MSMPTINTLQQTISGPTEKNNKDSIIYFSEKYYIKNLSPETLIDWNSVVDKSDEIGFFHCLELNEFYAKKENATNHSCIIYNSKENKPVLICPLFISIEKYHKFYRPDKKVAKCYYTSGPAFIRNLSEKIRRKIFNFLNEYLSEFLVRNKLDKIILYHANMCQYIFENNILINPLHELRGNWKPLFLAYYYLNLQQPIENILNSFDPHARASIKKLQSTQQFTIRNAEPKDLDRIYELFLKTQKRNKMPYHDKATFEWYLSYKGSNCYVAELNDNIVSVLNIGDYKNQAFYWASFTDENYLRTQVVTYLLWHGIVQMKSRGIIHFEIGDQPFGKIGSKFDSIANFKRNFRGQLRYKYSAELEKQTFSKTILFKLSELV